MSLDVLVLHGQRVDGIARQLGKHQPARAALGGDSDRVHVLDHQLVDRVTILPLVTQRYYQLRVSEGQRRLGEALRDGLRVRCVVVPAWQQGGVGAWVVCSGARLAALYLDYIAHRDLFDVQGAADDRVRRDAWLLGLLFLPDLLDLAAVRGWSEFARLLGRKIRNLLIALVLVGAFCFPFHALGLDRAMLNVPNVISPLPAGGCVWWRAGPGGARPAPGY